MNTDLSDWLAAITLRKKPLEPRITRRKGGERASHRLVIGNGAYDDAPKLKNPENDARDMAATLKALGFNVASGNNVNQREMKRLIREFGQALKGDGSGLFYYADSTDPRDLKNYLANYRNGAYASAAQIKLRRLEPASSLTSSNMKSLSRHFPLSFTHARGPVARLFASSC